ncbi:MAG: hypothetical protein KGJ73_00800 [Rhodospirillales bacterium]|nr:hypothetical protein [Rhodospirillales bacterium]
MALPLNQPQGRVSLGGVPIGGLIELEVQAPGPFLAGRFSAAFAMGTFPALGVGEFAALGNAPVVIEISTDGLSYTTLLTGQVENIRVDLAANTATLQGRDQTALLIDAEISESFVNQTASEIAETIAMRHGLIPNVTQTFPPVGQYYQIDHARTALKIGSRATTEWNLLCRLAEAQQFGVSVSGGALNFGPLAVGMQRPVTPASFASLQLDLVTALPAAVSVLSWNCRDKMAVSEGVGGGNATNIVRPNLTAAQASSYASSMLATVQQHGKVLLGKMPGETAINVGDALLLVGTNSELDDSYIVMSLMRRLNGAGGFVQMVKAYAVG